MSDDMVDRLRSGFDCLRYHECLECGTHWVRSCQCACHDELWVDAADEIERLRGELDHMTHERDLWRTNCNRLEERYG